MNENLKPCKMCGEPIEEEDWDVCIDCVSKHMTFKNAYAIGKMWGENVRINQFLLSVFDQEQINHILCAVFKLLPDDEQKEHIYNFCEDDMLYFMGWINGKK